MKKNNQGQSRPISERVEAGLAPLVMVVVIFVVGLAVGGLFYFFGSNASKLSVSQEKSTTQVEDTEEVIEKELDETQLDSIETDIKDLDQEAASY